MSDKYILDNRKAVPCRDLMTWAKWFETANRTVASTRFPGVHVSTVFLGIDHNWGECRRPLLFETMIFGGPHDEYQERCSTWEEAEAMHARAVALAAGEPA